MEARIRKKKKKKTTKKQKKHHGDLSVTKYLYKAHNFYLATTHTHIPMHAIFTGCNFLDHFSLTQDVIRPKLRTPTPPTQEFQINHGDKDCDHHSLEETVAG